MTSLAATATFALLLAACAAETDGTNDGTDALSAAGASDVTKIEFNRSTGFVAPPPPGGCNLSGNWTLDFGNKTIKGNACVNGTPTSVDRALADTEIEQVRAAIAQVRVVARPNACPTDVPANAMKTYRAKTQTTYADARASCYDKSVKPATSLDDVFDVLLSLSATAAGVSLAGVDTLEFNRSTGFVAPPAPGSCKLSGYWSIDLGKKTIKGNACVNAVPTSVDRVLTDADLAKLEAAIAKVRVVERPAACPTDIPAHALKTVSSKGGDVTYADPRASCYDKRVKPASDLDSVFDVLLSLSAD